MQTNTEHGYRLKFLNGPLAGHQLELPPGDLTMGVGDADVVVEIEGNHGAMLSVTEEGLSLTTSAQCWIDGRPTAGMSLTLPSHTPVDIGGVVFVIAAAGETFRATTIPPRIAVPRKRSTARTLSWLAVAALAAGASGAAGTALWRYSQTPAPGISAPIAPPVAERWQALAQSEGIQVARSDETGVALSGQCMDSTKRDQVLHELRSARQPFTDNTLCQDEIERSVRTVLRMHNYADVTVRPGDTYGTVAIVGRILADSHWQETVVTLSRIKGLRSWTVEDDGAKQIRKLIALLRLSNLSEKLSVVRDSDLFLLTGLLGDAERKQLESSLAQFSTQNPLSNRIIYQNIPLSSVQASVFSSPIVSFGESKKVPFIDLANGTRVTAGSRLPSGYLILQIDRRGIELERDGDVVYLPLTF